MYHKCRLYYFATYVTGRRGHVLDTCGRWFNCAICLIHPSEQLHVQRVQIVTMVRLLEMIKTR